MSRKLITRLGRMSPSLEGAWLARGHVPRTKGKKAMTAMMPSVVHFAGPFAIAASSLLHTGATHTLQVDMASKRAAVVSTGNESERPNKRPRFDQDAVETSGRSGSSLDHINSDCVLNILSYLPVDDLNSIAICGRRYRKARAHESLDQTRTGTIIVSEGCTFESFLRVFANNELNNVFHGNRTHLKIVGLARMEIPFIETRESETSERIVASVVAGVTSLELAANVHEASVTTIYLPDWLHIGILQKFPNLTQMSMTRCEHPCDAMRGFDFSPNLTDLSLNDCSYRYNVFAPLRSYFKGYSEFMFRLCPRLERLSIKNVTCRNFDETNRSYESIMPQEVIMKMVRYHPALRWLCSDLTQENIDILKQERPKITFVSE